MTAPDVDFEALRARVEKIWKDSKTSQRKLSEKAGLSQSFVESILNRRSKSPEVANLRKLAVAAGVDPDWLLTGKGPDVSVSIDRVHPTIASVAAARGYSDEEALAATGLVRGFKGTAEMPELVALEALEEARHQRRKFARTLGGSVVTDAGGGPLDDFGRGTKS